MKISKVVIAAAGYGTRFLPATKTVPKEMLPLIDKPIIQYLVEEAADSGLKQVIIVTRTGQHVLEDHFDSHFELEYRLKKEGKLKRLKLVKKPTKLADFIFIRQNRDLPYGNGTPLLCIKELLSPGEPFVYMFGDDLVQAKVPCTRQLLKFYEQNREAAAVVAVQRVAKSEVSRYGIISLKKGAKHRVEDIIEKPAPDEAPSRLAQFGRFILDERVISILEKQEVDKRGELWLADGLRQLAKKEPVLAHEIEGQWLTTGDPLRWLKTNIHFALKREDLAEAISDYLASLET